MIHNSIHQSVAKKYRKNHLGDLSKQTMVCRLINLNKVSGA
jgi:hypothetical protein